MGIVEFFNKFVGRFLDSRVFVGRFEWILVFVHVRRWILGFVGRFMDSYMDSGFLCGFLDS